MCYASISEFLTKYNGKGCKEDNLDIREDGEVIHILEV